MKDRLLTAVEVAELLSVPERFVREQTRAGRIPHVRLGRYVRYRAATLEAWVTANEAGGGIVRPRKHRPVVRSSVGNQSGAAGEAHG